MPETLDLLVPGLLGPMPVPVPVPVRALRTPTLDLLLDRAVVAEPAGDDTASVLLARFGAAASAPYALAADDPDWDRSGWWLHADPVHLRPDRDLLRLFDASHLGISRAEADALVAALNGHFVGDGLRFHAPVADRWYVECATPPRLDTTSLARVDGRHIDGALPTGPDASRWAALMSEAQMLLFQSPMNRAREAAGRPAVNGLWCWGGGIWQVPATPPALALGSAPLLRGLAAAAGIEHRARPGADAAELGVTRVGGKPGRVLVLWGGLDEALRDRDQDAWAGAAARLERWVASLPMALRRGEVRALRIDTCDGDCLLVRGLDLRWYRRLLRRPRALLERATVGSSPGPALRPPSGLLQD
jgi:hypothetical protein